MRFEELNIWTRGRILVRNIYIDTKNIKDYSFVDQMRRACVSITNNIAEGYERGTSKEFRQFLYIARGSCGEVRSMFYLANDLNYINPQKCQTYINELSEMSKMITGLIKKLG